MVMRKRKSGTFDANASLGELISSLEKMTGHRVDGDPGSECRHIIDRADAASADFKRGVVALYQAEGHSSGVEVLFKDFERVARRAVCLAPGRPEQAGRRAQRKELRATLGACRTRRGRPGLAMVGLLGGADVQRAMMLRTRRESVGGSEMSLMDAVKNAWSRSRVMQKATRQLMARDDATAIETIYTCLMSNESLDSVITLFSVTRNDVYSVLLQMLEFTNRELHAGHYIAVEALVCQDTLCYLMRAEFGQVPKPQAFQAVRDFCKANGKFFHPEHDYRAKHGLAGQ